MSVLTVGGFVFSSDPRIGVVASSGPGQVFGTWTLQIQRVGTRDAGEYQCQVNSEPKESLDVTLVVKGWCFSNTHIFDMKHLQDTERIILMPVRKRKYTQCSRILEFIILQS